MFHPRPKCFPIIFIYSYFYGFYRYKFTRLDTCVRRTILRCIFMGNKVQRWNTFIAIRGASPGELDVSAFICNKSRYYFIFSLFVPCRSIRISFDSVSCQNLKNRGFRGCCQIHSIPVLTVQSRKVDITWEKKSKMYNKVYSFECFIFEKIDLKYSPKTCALNRVAIYK